jgi:hypothetical protein
MFEGLRKEEDLIVQVVTLVSYGCPRQAIVHAFGLDERTVARWQERAGQQCQNVHEARVMQAKLHLEHVQADEIRVKGHRMIPWMAMAIMVSTRLWLGGVISEHRDRKLADQLMRMVKACCLPLCALLFLTDGWAAYAGSIRRAFRDKVKRGGKRGRCQLQAWPEIVIGTEIRENREQTRGRSDSAHGARHDRARGGTPGVFSRRDRTEYGLYRTLQWDDARAVGESDPPLSSCCSSPRSPRSGHVARRLYLQLVLAPS